MISQEIFRVVRHFCYNEDYAQRIKFSKDSPTAVSLNEIGLNLMDESTTGVMKADTFEILTQYEVKESTPKRYLISFGDEKNKSMTDENLSRDIRGIPKFFLYKKA